MLYLIIINLLIANNMVMFIYIVKQKGIICSYGVELYICFHRLSCQTEIASYKQVLS